MKQKLGWAAAITVLGIGTAALPLALVSSDQPPPPPMGINLGGHVRDHALVGDQPLPLLELPAPPTLAPDGFTLAEPPRQGDDVSWTGRQQPVEDGRTRKVLGQVDHADLPYLGHDEDDPEDEAHEAHEAQEAHEEDCAPGPAGSEWPADMGLTRIPTPDEIRRPPAGRGVFHDEPCEEPIEDEI